MIAAVATAESPRLYRCRYGNADVSPICSDDGPLSSGFASAVEISPTGDRIAVGTRDGHVDVLAVAGSASPMRLAPRFPVVSLAWLREPDWLAVGGADGTVAIFETLNYSELFRFAASKNPVSTLRWSPTTSKLAFAAK
jgi:WD40 repeat protein